MVSEVGYKSIKSTVSALKVFIIIVNHQASLSTIQQESTIRWTSSFHQTLLPLIWYIREHWQHWKKESEPHLVATEKDKKITKLS